MKKSQETRELLGFTHVELALLLKVPRRQISKFETGKGEISTKAKYLLAEMLGHLQSPETSLKRSSAVQEQLMKLQHQLQLLLKENEYQLAHTTRKIKASEKIYNAKIKALQLVDFLSSRTDSDDSATAAALRTIRNSANKTLQEQGLASLTKLKIKFELLQLEKIFLDAELRKLRLDTDFIGNGD